MLPIMRPSPLVVLALLGACTRLPPDRPTQFRKAPCQTFEPNRGLGNHLNPFEIAVDVEHRRIYSTSLANRTLGVYDADTHEILGMYPIRERALVRPDVVPDATGAAWVLGSSVPAVVRFAHHEDGRTQFTEPFVQTVRGVPLAEGGILVLGTTEAGEQRLQRFEWDGSVGPSYDVAERGLGLFTLLDGSIGLLAADWRGAGLQRLDSETLEPLDSCELPFPASRAAQLADGTIVLSSDTAIGLAGCDGAPPSSWEIGVENKDVVSLGSYALVLDRVGSGEGVDPNLGLARVVDADGVHEERGFVTAKNTGYGAYDGQQGLLWVNSEGTAEVVAYDPTTGTERARIRTGTFVDGLAVNQDASRSYFATGRLSNSVLRIDEGEIVAESFEVRWPFSPVLDRDRDRLWVVSQTEATLHALAPSELTLLQSVDPGLPSNALLTFSSLVLHPERGTLLFAESAADLLLEIDPVSGEELGRWSLGGPSIEDPDAIGQLEAIVDPAGDAMLLVRTSDGRVQRLDLATGSLHTAWLGAAELTASAGQNTVGIARLLEDSGLLYVGGLALDASTIERRPEHDLRIRRLIGAHPAADGHLLAVSGDGRAIVEIERDGTLVATQPFSSRELNAPTFRINEAQECVVVVQSQDARLCWFSFGRIRSEP